MSVTAHSSTRTRVWNLPNQITASRLVIAVALFFCLHVDYYAVSLILFLLAALTDWVDGYLARQMGQITQLGRILDPFADKFVICGTFIFLSAVPSSRIAPWMAVVLVGREMLVTALRSFLEQKGKDFSANIPGKLKMVFQCLAAVASLILVWMTQSGYMGLTLASWLPHLVTITVWLAVLSTLYSGGVYILAAARLLR